jgi:glycerol-3-phosphate dehydrogenase
VPRARAGNHDAITMLHPRDQRVMFVLPAGPFAIIGTTDTFTHVSADDVRATESDVAYLLEAANFILPDARLTRGDVVSAWAGIRPLMPSGGSEGQASREHAIDARDHTVTITGGKLTTYRVMARQVVDAVEQALGRAISRTATGARALPDDVPVPPARPGDLPAGDVAAGLPYTRDDVTRAVTAEMAVTLGDVLIRRTHIAFETQDNGRAAARAIAPVVGSLLRWEGPRVERELARYDAEVARIFTIDGA